MHSRIFQLSSEPIKKENYITESNYYDHWFATGWADYVSDDCDRSEDIEWLQECVNGIVFGQDEQGEYLTVESKTAYFSRKFEAFKTILNEIKDCTLEEFSMDINMDMKMYRLKQSYVDKTGFYVDVDGQLQTFDEFVRYSEIGDKYYIGGTVDYHF